MRTDRSDPDRPTRRRIRHLHVGFHRRTQGRPGVPCRGVEHDRRRQPPQPHRHPRPPTGLVGVGLRSQCLRHFRRTRLWRSAGDHPRTRTPRRIPLALADNGIRYHSVEFGSWSDGHAADRRGGQGGIPADVALGLPVRRLDPVGLAAAAASRRPRCAPGGNGGSDGGGDLVQRVRRRRRRPGLGFNSLRIPVGQSDVSGRRRQRRRPAGLRRGRAVDRRGRRRTGLSQCTGADLRSVRARPDRITLVPHRRHGVLLARRHVAISGPGGLTGQDPRTSGGVRGDRARAARPPAGRRRDGGPHPQLHCAGRRDRRNRQRRRAI
ncbi:hypothetical protein PICSAR25_01038 [Mycobacterium avium subsp. paratuberculosis]|nr:hypothetical protein PICSAR25_01038 [Mycobacterium avium subsp. paratuberculosis]